MSLPLHYWYRGSHQRFNGDAIGLKSVWQFKNLGEHKSLRFTRKRNNLVENCSMRNQMTFSKIILAMTLKSSSEGLSLNSQSLLTSSAATFYQDIHRSDWVHLVGDSKARLRRCIPFFYCLNWIISNNWPVRELSEVM